MVKLESLISCGRTVEWRRRTQGPYSEDKRNGLAAAILDSLEAQVSALNGSPLHERLMKLWEAEERCSGERDRFSEIVSEELRAVGFTSFPATARDLLEAIANHLEGVNDLEEEAALIDKIQKFAQ